MPNPARHLVDVPPTLLLGQISGLVQAVSPSEEDIRTLQQELRERHRVLPGLRSTVEPEEVVEGLVRCIVIDHLQRRFDLGPDDIPQCINSSHRAVRRVCVARSQHRHDAIPDSEWASAWAAFQKRHPESNVDAASRKRARRADLYVAARSGLISLEFKYIGQRGLADQGGCVAQMRRYKQSHAATLLIAYSASDTDTDSGLARLARLLGGGVGVVHICGPTIPMIHGATANA